MAEASPPAESTKYPGYFFHPTLPMVQCDNEAQEKALPAGYRSTPYTEEEADAFAKAAAEAEAHEGETPTAQPSMTAAAQRRIARN